MSENKKKMEDLTPEQQQEVRNKMQLGMAVNQAQDACDRYIMYMTVSVLINNLFRDEQSAQNVINFWIDSFKINYSERVKGTNDEQAQITGLNMVAESARKALLKLVEKAEAKKPKDTEEAKPAGE